MESLLFVLVGFGILFFVNLLEKVLCRLDKSFLEKVGKICAIITWICIFIIIVLTILPINALPIRKPFIFLAVITFVIVLATEGACRIKETP